MLRIITILIVAMTISATNLFAQTNTFPTSGSVGIGTTTPQTTAILDIQSTTQGMLVPRMTKAQRDAIVSPANGLLIYQTNSSPGFYFYSSGWKALKSTTYTAGTGINIAGASIINTMPDQTVVLNGTGATTVSGSYPNFTINSTDNNTTYSAGSGIDVTGTVISNTSPDQTVTLTGDGATTITGTYPNFTISSTDVNTTYTAGSGIDVTGSVITNTAPDQTVNITGSGATTVTGSYPNFTVASSAYTAGTGIDVTGTVITNTAPDQTISLTSGLGINITGTYPAFTITNAGDLTPGDDANLSLSNLTTTSINQTLLPSSSAFFNLGSTAKTWSSAYLDGTLYLDNQAYIQNLGTRSEQFGNTLNTTNTGNDNLFMGDSSGTANTSGAYNTYIGSRSGRKNTTGTQNTYIGYAAGNKGTTASSNTAIGYQAGILNTANNNTMIGSLAGWSNTSGSENVFMGANAGFFNTTGSYGIYIGEHAGYNNTTGTSNIFIGRNAGQTSTNKSYNTIIGNFAGSANNANYNTFIGYQAGMANTFAENNVFIGYNSGLNVTSGGENTFVGMSAGTTTTTGNNNVYVGHLAGNLATSGVYNTLVGKGAGQNQTTGDYNTFIGGKAGYNNVTRDFCTAVGYEAGYYNDGENNTYVGYIAGYNNTTGYNNAFVGSQAGANNTTGRANTFMGYYAGLSNTTGYFNTFIGTNAGRSSTMGTYNVCLGNEAGYFLNAGSNNTILGSGAGYNMTLAKKNVVIGTNALNTPFQDSLCVYIGYDADKTGATDLTNVICIGAGATMNVSNAVRIGNTSITRIGIGRIPDAANIMDFQMTTARLSLGGAWVDASDKKLKEHFEQLDKKDILDKINSLEITRWNYKVEDASTRHIGPMADEFYQLFSVGDDSTIAAMDKAGVALVGIQALSEQVEATATTQVSQQEQITMLMQKIAALESQLGNAGTTTSSPVQKLSIPGNTARLDQNTPNPFNGTTTIRYYAPETAHRAQISIFTQQGVSLLTADIQLGEGTLELDATLIASGTYYYTLIIDGERVETRMMQLTR